MPSVAPSPADIALEALRKAGITHALENMRVFENSGWQILLEEVPVHWPSEFPGKIEERVPDVLAGYTANENFVLKALIEFKKGAENAIWYFLKRRSDKPDLTAPHVRTNAGDSAGTLGVVAGVGWLDFPTLGYVHDQPQVIYDKVATTPTDNQTDFYKARRQLAIGERAVLEDEFTSLLGRKRKNQQVPELTYIISVILTNATLMSAEVGWRTDGSLNIEMHSVDLLVFQSTRPASTMFQPLGHLPLNTREIFLRQHIFVVNSSSFASFLRDAKTVQI